jgi:hypothetical protein
LTAACHKLILCAERPVTNYQASQEDVKSAPQCC